MTTGIIKLDGERGWRLESKPNVFKGVRC